MTAPHGSTYFSADYQTARLRFREAVEKLPGQRRAYSVETLATDEDDDAMVVDVAHIGKAQPAWVVVVSSGLHGVEGFFGSAIQLAWLKQFAHGETSLEDGAVVFVHGLNPYGFATVRRFNEDNVDLNRNFLESPDDYDGSPQAYAALDSLLNPPTPPATLEFFRLQALRQIRRHGLAALKNAVAGGQFEFPLGLFFGGWGPAQTTRLVQTQFREWIAGADRVVHIDLHSGLGKFGDYQLLLPLESDSPLVAWYRDTFDSARVEPRQHGDGTAYTLRGEMGGWLTEHLPEIDYRYLCAEFGTYAPLRVLASLRRENQAHFYSQPASRAFRKAKQELLECFCPGSTKWRNAAIDNGLRIIAQGIAGASS